MATHGRVSGHYLEKIKGLSGWLVASLLMLLPDYVYFGYTEALKVTHDYPEMTVVHPLEGAARDDRDCRFELLIAELHFFIK